MVRLIDQFSLRDLNHADLYGKVRTHIELVEGQNRMAVVEHDCVLDILL